jgi:predicted nucleotidyltransferase
VLETLVDELAPEEIWLFGSRGRGTHGPESDWDVLVVVPDDQPEDLAARPGLVALRRAHVELFVVHRSNFEDAREVVGTLSHTASTQGRLVYGR